MRMCTIFRVVILAGFCHLTIASYSQFAKGADIGWLSEMEASGRKFYFNSGTQGDLLDILKGKGINSIRLRVWVNPVDGYCGKQDVVNQAVRAKNKGFRIMIDFHYSDWWADPGQQNKPAAWVGHNITQLQTDVKSHTLDVLSAIKTAGVTPEWVQVGNETNNGMLWEEGKASTNMANFAKLVTSGYDAVKTVFPNSKVIVHISNGFDNALFRWMFDGLKNNGAKWDVIGMSLYPEPSDWQTLTSQCLTNMKDMVSRYNKEIMIAEVGMDVTQAETCKAFLLDIIAKNKSLANNKGLGVFYWEPGCFNGWKGYGKGAFGTNGRPTVAMDAFLDPVVADLNESTYEVGSVNVFPNPFTHKIKLKANGDFEYEVRDLTGVAVEKGKAQEQVEVGEEWSAGLYLISIQSEKGTFKLKISKQ